MQDIRFFMFSKLNYNTTLEIIWNLLPILCLCAIAIPSFSLLYSTEDSTWIDFIIKVLGSQWYWTYEFNVIENQKDIEFSFDSLMLIEEDILANRKGFRLLEVDQRLSLFQDTYIAILITSIDVLHSWAVPSLGIKSDACPGRLNQILFCGYRLGIFYGQCSEICGINHAYMPIVLNIEVF